jgi:hypothetical protein
MKLSNFSAKISLLDCLSVPAVGWSRDRVRNDLAEHRLLRHPHDHRRYLGPLHHLCPGKSPQVYFYKCSSYIHDFDDITETAQCDH